MAVAIKWYEKELKKMVTDTAMGAIKKGCFLVEGDAKILCPIITTRLRGSISSNWHGSGMARGKTGGVAKADDGIGQPEKELTGVVGTNVEYARRVEMGFVGTDSLGRTYNQAPNPYLRPALEKNRSKILALFKDLIK